MIVKIWSHCFLSFVSLLIHFSISFGQDREKVRLQIGSPAPAFKIAEWIKGDPVPIMERGKVSVIEFTIVGCGPCIKAIPHLTALNNKYAGKINFVSVFANGKYVTPVKRLVKNYSEDISYSVAVDTPEEFMKEHWIDASTDHGFPTVFIVDQKGVIAWIGNPLNKEFKAIVENIYSESFDKYQQLEEEKKAREQIRKAFETSLTPAYKGGIKELSIAVKFLDSLINIDPRYLRNKFQLLLKFDEKNAYNVAEEALNQRVVDAYFLSDFLHEIYRLKNPDWRVYRDIANYLFQNENRKQAGAGHLRSIADSYYLEGDLDSAIITQKRLIEHLEKYNPDKADWLINDINTLDWYNQIKSKIEIGRISIHYSSIDSLVNTFESSYLGSEQYPTIREYNQRECERKGYQTFRSIPLSYLYRLAYLDEVVPSRESLTRIIYDIKDINKLEKYFVSPEKYNKYFNYNLVIPNSMAKTASIMAKMQNDLRNAFGIEGELVSASVPVWRLTATKDAVKELSTKRVKNEYKTEVTKDGIKMKASPYYLIDAISKLSPGEFYKSPILDETGIKFSMEIKLQIQFKENILDISFLNKELNSYGLNLVKDVRQMTVLIIKDFITN